MIQSLRVFYCWIYRIPLHLAIKIFFHRRYNTNIASLHLEKHNYIEVRLIISDCGVCFCVCESCSVFWVNCYVQKILFEFLGENLYRLYRHPPSKADTIFTGKEDLLSQIVLIYIIFSKQASSVISYKQ